MHEAEQRFVGASSSERDQWCLGWTGVGACGHVGVRVQGSACGCVLFSVVCCREGDEHRERGESDCGLGPRRRHTSFGHPLSVPERPQAHCITLPGSCATRSGTNILSIIGLLHEAGAVAVQLSRRTGPDSPVPLIKVAAARRTPGAFLACPDSTTHPSQRRPLPDHSPSFQLRLSLFAFLFSPLGPDSIEQRKDDNPGCVVAFGFHPCAITSMCSPSSEAHATQLCRPPIS